MDNYYDDDDNDLRCESERDGKKKKYYSAHTNLKDPFFPCCCCLKIHRSARWPSNNGKMFEKSHHPSWLLCDDDGDDQFRRRRIPYVLMIMMMINDNFSLNFVFNCPCIYDVSVISESHMKDMHNEFLMMMMMINHLEIEFLVYILTVFIWTIKVCVNYCLWWDSMYIYYGYFLLNVLIAMKSSHLHDIIWWIQLDGRFSQQPKIKPFLSQIK